MKLFREALSRSSFAKLFREALSRSSFAKLFREALSRSSFAKLFREALSRSSFAKLFREALSRSSFAKLFREALSRAFTPSYFPFCKDTIFTAFLNAAQLLQTSGTLSVQLSFRGAAGKKGASADVPIKRTHLRLKIGQKPSRRIREQNCQHCMHSRTVVARFAHRLSTTEKG